MKNHLKYPKNYFFWDTITFEELQNGNNAMLMKLSVGLCHFMIPFL